jgi:hypothetical protein
MTHERSFIFGQVQHNPASAILAPMISIGRLGVIASLSIFCHATAWGQGFAGPPRGYYGAPVIPPWMLAPPEPTTPYPPMQTPRFMSDTPEYCAELLEDIEHYRQRVATVPPNAEMLVAEGQHLCEIGHYRPGITRLRTALMLLRHER